jgi:hypothetical protein
MATALMTIGVPPRNALPMSLRRPGHDREGYRNGDNYRRDGRILVIAVELVIMRRS